MIRYDPADIGLLKKKFDPRIVNQAQTSAQKKVALKTRTQISKKVRIEYNVKARDIAQSVKVTRVKGGRLLAYRGLSVPLVVFGGSSKRVQSERGPRRAATVRIKKSEGRKIVGRREGFHGKGFLAKGKIYARKTSKQHSIRQLYGLSIPQMVGNQVVLTEIEGFIEIEYPRIFSNEMNFFINKSR